MSRKLEDPLKGYSRGLRKPSGALPAFCRASLISAQKPAHTGALQLVPPICCTWPLKITSAPVFGSAARLTSGTRRPLPCGTPAPFCHTGRPKKTLRPPPLSGHPDSRRTVPLVARVRLVPPTPITDESDDAYSACSGPVEPWPVLSGFEPASPLDTNTLTPAAARRRN